MPLSADSSEVDAFLRSHPGTRFVDVLLPDLCGIPRGKRVTAAELKKVYSGSFYLPASMFALDVLGHTVEKTGLGFDEGDADRVCLPVPGTLVPVPWIDQDGVAQVQITMLDHDSSPFYGDPRYVLHSVLERFRALGLRPVVAIELEFYLVDPERTPAGHIRPPAAPVTGRREYRTQINSMSDLDNFSSILASITTASEIQAVPAGTALAEYGPGQYEVNLHHVDDALTACDHAIRLKRIVKGVALKHGMEATFMPKPYADMAGSGAHIHVSLLDGQRCNIFASEDPAGSEQLRHAIGGLAATMADAMLIFAPTPNAYRRFRPETYVPLHPSWGINNRGVALRVPVSSPENRRVEHRVAGADVNPYLLAAVVLAGIHHGLTGKLDPGPPVRGNAYAREDVGLPTNWPSAVAAFERSDFIGEYLGQEFQRLFTTTRRSEFEAFEANVTPTEYEWYVGPC